MYTLQEKSKTFFIKITLMTSTISSDLEDLLMFCSTIFQGDGDLYGTDCDSCAQAARRTRIKTVRAKLKKREVPEAAWPKYNETTIPANRSCLGCQKRLEQYRNQNRRKTLKKLTSVVTRSDQEN